MNSHALASPEGNSATERHVVVALPDPVEEMALDNYEAPRYVVRSTNTLASTGSCIIGASPSMRSLFKKINILASLSTTILIRGKTGVGKELVALALHYNDKSNQRQGKFVPVNCAGIPQTLLESHLFGHVRGAFTDAYADRRGFVEEANGGTLFLDEIGDMSQDLQAKVLRLLQEHEIVRVGDTAKKQVNVRIIAATNQDLEKKMQESAFRNDLFYRINTFPLIIPPVTERLEDIPHLARHFIEKYNEAYAHAGIVIEGATEDALKKLQQHPWPGNVRELENIIARAMILCSHGQLQDEDIVFDDQELQKKTLAAPRHMPCIAPVGAAHTDSSWYGRGVLPIMYAELQRQRGHRSCLSIRRMVEQNEIYAVNMNAVKNVRTFALMLTPEMLNSCFAGKEWKLYHEIEQKIRASQFNEFARQPFMFASFSRLRRLGIKFSNEVFQDVLRRLQPYCIQERSNAYLALNEEQATAIALDDGRRSDPLKISQSLKGEIQRQYEHFLHWRPGEPSWQVL